MNLYDKKYKDMGVRSTERKLSLIEELKGRNENKFSSIVNLD